MKQRFQIWYQANNLDAAGAAICAKYALRKFSQEDEDAVILTELETGEAYPPIAQADKVFMLGVNMPQELINEIALVAGYLMIVTREWNPKIGRPTSGCFTRIVQDKGKTLTEMAWAYFHTTEVPDVMKVVA